MLAVGVWLGVNVLLGVNVCVRVRVAVRVFVDVGVPIGPVVLVLDGGTGGLVFVGNAVTGVFVRVFDGDGVCVAVLVGVTVLISMVLTDVPGWNKPVRTGKIV